MKRVCTKTEQELLYQNRKQLLKGTWIIASAVRLGDVFVSLSFSAVIMFAGIAWIADTFHGSVIVFSLWLLFSLSVPGAIVMLMINRGRLRKKTRLFLKQEGLMINGATIVGANDSVKRFAYIEDDLQDEDGKPVVIEYPLRPREMSSGLEGERILVLYGSEDTFQLMRVNDALKKLLPDCPEHYPLEGGLDAYTCVPNPNVLKIDRQGHVLSAAERESFAALYTGNDRQERIKPLKTLVTIVAVCLALICLILDVSGEFPFYRTAPVLTGGFAVYVFLLYLAMRRAVKQQKQQINFVQVKEVVFLSHERGAVVSVYEWLDGKINICQYPAGRIPLNMEYGSILYRLENMQGQVFLMNKTEVSL